MLYQLLGTVISWDGRRMKGVLSVQGEQAVVECLCCSGRACVVGLVREIGTTFCFFSGMSRRGEHRYLLIRDKFFERIRATFSTLPSSRN